MDTPDPLVIVGGAAAAALVVSILAKLLGGSGQSKGPAKRGRFADAGVNKAIEKGDYDGAALRAAQAGDLESAYELYVRAQQPVKAAQIAIRLGKPALAAELYERAGDLARAATAYRQAGMNSKASELAPQAQSTAVPIVFGTDGKAPAKIAGPAERAEAAESQWRAAQREVRPGDKEAEARLTGYAQTAVELWLSAGDIKRAAGVCREAGLIEEAVSLYVNVLGEPGAAAQLVASRGDHKRAAELYELAGQKERSLQAWVDWSSGAADPLEHLADVKRLGDDAPSRLFQAILTARPISPANLELHYRVGMAMEGDPKQAKAVFERISSIDPGYRDVGARIEELGRAITKLSAEGTLGKPPAPPEASRSPPPPARKSAEPAQIPKEALEHLVSDVASRAAEMIKREARAMANVPATAASPGVVRTPIPTPGGSTIVNVHAHQKIDINFQIAGDPLVKEARRGPSLAQLRGMINGRPPDLGNIEVYYRLGLALLARGQYGEAQEAFGSVEEVSPGYRDAAERASQVSAWKSEIAPALVPGGASGALAKRYTLLGELGRGGMAVVFRARDEALGREVALKFLTEEAVGNAVFMQFFQREARAAGSLNHPNIVTIYDVGELDGRAFICMELVDGVSIDAVLEKEKRLPLFDALRVAEQVLIALEYAHQKKIIHRDIKPANIMRGPTGSIKLMDFGLAKSIEGQGQKSTIISGTPSYMAPEQLTGKGVDPRVDLFALGATLYELLTGDVPFHGMVRVESPKSVREALPVAPTLLDELLLRSMEFDKERRFASATAMLEPVREILSGMDKIGTRGAPPILVPRKEKGGTVLGVGSALGSRSLPREEPVSSDRASPNSGARTVVEKRKP